MDAPNPNHLPTMVEDLTDRELDVLRLKAQNRSNQEIADELVLALSTVKWYVRQVYGKLGVENRRQAVARAQALGLIEGAATPGMRPRHNLPAQTSPFIGREQECDDLTALLADPDARLITILAPGGMGKTRLGLAVAEAHLDRFADGVYMVPLAPLRAPDQIVTAIADATGFPFAPDGRSPEAQVLDFLRHKHMLLVLDNFEHLLDGAGFVTEILHAAPDVQIVATTRERLALRGETVYTIGGMIFPDWETPEDALEYDAVRLFAQCAEQVCPGFAIHAGNLQFLARICRLVEGMPLGIVLAAAWTEVLSLEEIADEIQGSFDFLAAEMRDMPRRQWSIRAVFEPTWNRLTDSERDAFMRFSVFRGGCTREAVQAVTGADLRTLQALINKALLDRDLAGRYQIHELLRQYAEQQLETANLTDETCDIHCTHYLDFLIERESEIKGECSQAAFETIDTDFENVRMAWQWAVENREEDVLHQAAVSLGLFAEFGRRSNEVGMLFRLAHDRFRQPGEALAPGWVQLLVCHRGDETLPAPFSVEQTEQSLAVAYQQNDVFLACCALCLLRHGLTQNQDMSDVLAMHEDNLNHWQALDDPFDLGWALVDTAVCFTFAGQPDQTIDLLQRSVRLFRVAENKLMLGISLNNLANKIANTAGDYAESKRLLHEALTLSDNTDSFANSSLGLQYFYTGDFEDARVLFETAQAIAADINHYRAKTWSLDYLAMLACVEGDYRSAQRLVEEGASLRKIRVLDRPNQSAWVSAIVACGLADYQAARQQLYSFLELSLSFRSLARAATGLSIAALIRGHTGDPIGAAELLGLAFTHPKSATGWMERWDLLTAFRADLEADLGSDAYHAAWERGAALDLETVIVDLLDELAG